MSMFHISIRWPDEPGAGLDLWFDGYHTAAGAVADAMQEARDKQRPTDITVHTDADFGVDRKDLEAEEAISGTRTE